MIRTAGGQTYKIPHSAVQGRQPGQQIVIKCGSPNGAGQLSQTTTATILQIFTPPAAQNASMQNKTALTQSGQSPATSIVRQQSSQATTKPAGVVASSASTPATSTNKPQETQAGKPQATVNISTAVNKEGQQVQMATIRISTDVTAGLSGSTPVRIPIKLPDGRVQVLQLPASFLSTNNPIQIQLPTTPAAKSIPTPLPQQQSASAETQTKSLPDQSASIPVTSSPVKTDTEVASATAVETRSAQSQSAATTVVSSLPSSSAASNQTASIAASTLTTPAPITTVSAFSNVTNMTTSAPKSDSSITNTAAAPISVAAASTTVATAINGPGQIRIIPASMAGQQRIVQLRAATPTQHLIQSPLQMTKGLAGSANLLNSQIASPNGGLRVQLPAQNTPLILTKSQQTGLVCNSSSNRQIVVSKPTNSGSTVQSALVGSNQVQQLVQSPASSKLILVKQPPQVNQSPIKQSFSAAGTANTHQALHLTNSSDRRTSTPISSYNRNISRSNKSATNASNSGLNIAGGSLSNEDRDLLAIKTLMKAMLDKLEKDERQEVKRVKMRENQLMTRWRQHTSRSNVKLHRNIEVVRKEITRKRALVQHRLQQEIDDELSQLLRQRQEADELARQQQLEAQEQKRLEKEKKNHAKLCLQQLPSSSSITAGHVGSSGLQALDGASSASVVRTGQTSVKIKVRGLSPISAAAYSGIEGPAAESVAVVSTQQASTNGAAVANNEEHRLSSNISNNSAVTATAAAVTAAAAGSQCSNAASGSVTVGSCNKTENNKQGSTSSPENVKKAEKNAAVVANCEKSGILTNSSNSIPDTSSTNSDYSTLPVIAQEAFGNVIENTFASPPLHPASDTGNNRINADHNLQNQATSHTATDQITALNEQPQDINKFETHAAPAVEVTINSNATTLASSESTSDSINKTSSFKQQFDNSNKSTTQTTTAVPTPAKTSAKKPIRESIITTRKRKAALDKSLSELNATNDSSGQSATVVSIPPSKQSRSTKYFTIMDSDAPPKPTTKGRKLYCFCKTAFDPNRIMIACIVCHQWYHYDCLDLKEDLVKKEELEAFTCPVCRIEFADELSEEQLALKLPDLSTFRSVTNSSFENNKNNSISDNQVSSVTNKRKADALSPAKQLNHLTATNGVSIKKSTSDCESEVSSTSDTSGTPNDESAMIAVTMPTVKKTVFLNRKQQPSSASSRQSSTSTTREIASKRKSTATAGKTTSKTANPDSILYCLCQQEYNAAQFYVYCGDDNSGCGDWLHGRCVGVLSKEAEKMDVYLCPRCAPDDPQLNRPNQKPLTSQDYASLKTLLQQIKNHRNAWPFKEPVDGRQVSDYYTIITEPMDLSTIEKKLSSKQYKTLTSFIGDVTKIFDNCRYYNSLKSMITLNANALEAFFVDKIKAFRGQMMNE